jgi:hypothetical protein
MRNGLGVMSNSEIAQLRCVLTRELVQMHRPEIADIVYESKIFVNGLQMLLVPSAHSLEILSDELTEWLQELLKQATCRAGIRAEAIALILPDKIKLIHG